MKTLFIIAGHSNTQSGAVSDDYKEHEETILDKKSLEKAVRYQLGDRTDVKVWTDNDNDSLNQVISQVKQIAKKDDLLLDIHYNASGNRDVDGVEAFIAVNARDKSRRVATRLVELYSKMLDIPNRGVKLENESQHNRLGILHSNASSVLIEVRFLTNKKGMDEQEVIRDRLYTGVANILVQELDKT